MPEDTKVAADDSADRARKDGLASMAILGLTVVLIVFLITRIV